MFWSNLAIQHRAVNDYEAAVTDMLSAPKMGDRPILWNNLGSLYTEIRRFEMRQRPSRTRPSLTTRNGRSSLVHCAPLQDVLGGLDR
jgi:hypothetical protein